MTRINDCRARQAIQGLQTVIHHFRVAPGQICSTTSVKKKRVSRDQTPVNQEALRPGSVTWRVNQGDVDIANFDNVTSLMSNEICFRNTSCT